MSEGSKPKPVSGDKAVQPDGGNSKKVRKRTDSSVAETEKGEPGPGNEETAIKLTGKGVTSRRTRRRPRANKGRKLPIEGTKC
jgi:hypothetical protein